MPSEVSSSLSQQALSTILQALDKKFDEFQQINDRKFEAFLHQLHVSQEKFFGKLNSNFEGKGYSEMTERFVILEASVLEVEDASRMEVEHVLDETVECVLGLQVVSSEPVVREDKCGLHVSSAAVVCFVVLLLSKILCVVGVCAPAVLSVGFAEGEDSINVKKCPFGFDTRNFVPVSSERLGAREFVSLAACELGVSSLGVIIFWSRVGSEDDCSTLAVVFMYCIGYDAKGSGR